MSTIWKVVLVLVVVGAVGFGWKYMSSKNEYANPQTTNNTGYPSTGVSVNSTTNASLDQDMNSINSHMNAVDQSSAQVDQSVSDKPVTQTE